MKVKVTGGWSLGLEDQERRYSDGETFDAPDELAEQWIAAGQAVAVKAMSGSANKAVTSSPNKSAISAPKKPAKKR
jgi:hypothetical protein